MKVLREGRDRIGIRSGLVFAIAALLASSVHSAADETAAELQVVFGDDLPVRLADLPFGIGEQATFEIGYGPIKAGEATITVQDTLVYFGQKVLHVRTRARSNRFFDPFFKVRDQADSYIDADSLFTRYFAKHLREGGYERDVEIHFDQVNGIAYFPDGKSSEFPYGVHDILSAFFRVRTLDLPEGARFAMPTHGDKSIYDLEVVVVRREVRDTVLGRVPCVVVQPRIADDGLFKHQGDLFVWLTDDARRVPVLMKANVPVGAIEARLVSYRPADRRP
jgi:hypothetical protein